MDLHDPVTSRARARDRALAVAPPEFTMPSVQRVHVELAVAAERSRRLTALLPLRHHCSPTTLALGISLAHVSLLAPGAGHDAARQAHQDRGEGGSSQPDTSRFHWPRSRCRVGCIGRSLRRYDGSPRCRQGQRRYDRCEPLTKSARDEGSVVSICPHSALGYLAPEEFAARSSQNQRAG